MRARWLLACLSICLFLSTDVKAQQWAFAVSFKDKQGSTGSLSNVSAFLSSKSITRRYLQNISVDTTDLPVSAPYIDSVVTLTNGLLHETSKWLNLCVVLLTDSSQILNLQNKPYITGIKYIAHYNSFHPKPNPKNSLASISAAAKTTGSQAYYGASYQQISLLQGDCIQDLGFKGQGKLIAVLDAGFGGVDTIRSFDSLHLAGRIVDTHNFTLNSNSVYDYDTHGTSVLSTMAADSPGYYVGTAPYANYALYITEDNNSEQPVELYNLVAGAERADSAGADVITCSLGYDTFDLPFGINYYNFNTDFDGKTTVASQGVNFATKKGILFVTSAGNDASNPDWPHILTPSDADSALTIGAVDINQNIYPASGIGPNAAGQVKPDVCAVGWTAYILTSTGTISTDDGTSFSTPQMAGLAACLWEAAGEVGPYAIRKAIDSSGTFHNNPGTQRGYGVPNFCQALQLLDVKDTPKNPLGTDWIKVGPNPVADNAIVLHLYLTSYEAVSFHLYDIAGKEVLSSQMNLFTGYNSPVYLQTGNLPSGMYILKASTTTQQQVIKVEKL